MAKLRDKVDDALNEARTLILGAQVLLGFQFESFFKKTFDSLSPASQYIKLGGLGLIMLAIALLMWPAPFHRLVEGGQDTKRFHGFTTRVVGAALLPFAAALGADAFVTFDRVLGRSAGVAAGAAFVAVALFFWYGLEMYRRAASPEERRRKEGDVMEGQGDGQQKGTDLTHRIKHVLTETRVVLPGAQALLGFQFITVLSETFENQPQWAKYTHLAGLGLVAIATVLLMAPAAYHRIVEEGEETERFHSFASRMVLAAMVPLALGIACDVVLVTNKVLQSPELAIGLGAVTVLVFYGMWFGYTLYAKATEGGARERAAGGEVARQH